VEAQEIVDYFENEITYKKEGWSITAAHAEEMGVVLVNINFKALDSSVGGMTEFTRFRLIQPGDGVTRDFLRKFFAAFVISIEVHEALEFIVEHQGLSRKRCPDLKVYHPHRADGQANWQTDGPYIMAMVKP
jgi:hypothetical protein